MRLKLICLAGASLAMAQTGIDEVRAWMPLRAGDRWVYRIENRSGTRDQPEVEQWQQTVTFTGEFVTPARLTITGAAVESNHSPHPPAEGIRVITPSGQPAIVHRGESPERAAGVSVEGNCIYFTRSRRKDLPDICFPLYEGATWGDPSRFRDHWRVAGQGKKNADDPPSIQPDDWRIEAHLASGDDNYVWFRKGVGVVAERTWHNGTYDDRTTTLISSQLR